MRLDETRSVIRYFLEADVDFLNGMGVDPKKLPSESTWFELLKEDFIHPRQNATFWALSAAEETNGLRGVKRCLVDSQLVAGLTCANGAKDCLLRLQLSQLPTDLDL